MSDELEDFAELVADQLVGLTGEEIDGDGDGPSVVLAWLINLSRTEHRLVAVPADTARLLTPEVIAALPALLRVVRGAWQQHIEECICEMCEALPPATWEALGEALGGGS